MQAWEWVSMAILNGLRMAGEWPHSRIIVYLWAQRRWAPPLLSPTSPVVCNFFFKFFSLCNFFFF